MRLPPLAPLPTVKNSRASFDYTIQPQLETPPAPSIVTEASQNEETLLAAITPITAMRWVVKGLIYVAKLAKIPITDRMEAYLYEQVGNEYTPTRAETLVDEHLATKRSFKEAILYLNEREQLSPLDAFTQVIRFVLNRPAIDMATTKADPTILDTGYFDITESDLRWIREKWSIPVDQLRLAIEGEATRTFHPDAIEALSDLLDQSQRIRAKTDNIPAHILARTLEMTRQDMESLLKKWIVRYGRASVALLDSITAQLDAKANAVGGLISVQFGSDTIALDLSDIPADQRAIRLHDFRESWRRILSGETSSLATPFSHEFSAINNATGMTAIRRLAGETLEENLRAREAGATLLAQAMEITPPYARGLRRFLLRLRKSESDRMGLSTPTGDGIVTWHHNGGFQRNIVAMHDRFSAQVGPFTFYPSRMVRIQSNGKIRHEPALLIIDRRGRASMLTESEFNRILTLSNRMADLPREHPSPERLVAAFDGFLTDLKRAWLSVSWEQERLQKTSARIQDAALAAGAEHISRYHGVYELIRELRLLTSDFQDLRLHAESETGEFRDLVRSEMAIVRDKYRHLFPDDQHSLWDREIAAIERAVISGDTHTVLQSRKILRDHLFTAMAEALPHDPNRYRGNVGTSNFASEVIGWLQIASSNQALPAADALAPLLLTRERSLQPPSLDQANRWRSSGLLQEAMSEFWRVGTEPAIHIDQRMSALSDLILTAHEARNMEWLERALSEMGYQASQSVEIGPKGREALLTIADYEANGLITIPAILSRTLHNGVGITDAVDFALSELTSHHPCRLKLTNRPNILSQNAVHAIQALISDSTQTLSLIKSSKLMWLATLTVSEYAEYRLNQGVEGPLKEHLDLFYSQARDIIARDGYDREKMALHPAVVALSRMSVDEFSAAKKVHISPRMMTAVLFADTIDPASVAETVSERSPFWSIRLTDRELSRWPRLYDARDIIAPSLTGVGAFMTIKSLEEELLDPANQTWEAMLRGYGIMAGASSMESALYSRLPTSSTSPSPLPTPFSIGATFGHLGSGIAVWRGLSETARLVGASPTTAEWAGLLGMSALFSSYQPLLRQFRPNLYHDIVAPAIELPAKFNGIIHDSMSPAIQTASRMLHLGGALYFATDLVLGSADAVVDVSVDPIDAFIRNDEYLAMKTIMQRNSFFGEAGDFSLRSAYYTTWGLLDTLVPAAWHKLVTDISGSQWRDNRRAEIMQAYQNLLHEQAIQMGRDASSSFQFDLINAISRAIVEPAPPSLTEIVQRLSEKTPITLSEKAFSNWQLFASISLPKHDRYWLFNEGAIHNGAIQDPTALLYWQAPILQRTLDAMETYVTAQMEIHDDARSFIELINTIDNYRSEINSTCTMYAISHQNNFPEQMSNQSSDAPICD